MAYVIARPSRLPKDIGSNELKLWPAMWVAFTNALSWTPASDPTMNVLPVIWVQYAPFVKLVMH